MAKLTTSDLANLQNESTAVATLNANFALVETAMENTLSRDGTSPNSMSGNIDMDSHRIINLPTPTSAHEPVRLSDMVAGTTFYLTDGTFSWVLTDRALTDVNTAQNILPTTNDSFTLAGSTVYYVRASIYISRAAGTTNHTIGFKSGGSATFTAASLNLLGGNGTGTTPGQAANFVSMLDPTSNTTFTAASTAAAEKVHLQIDGIMIVNAGGTFIPQITYSAAPGGVMTVEAGSYFMLRPLGAATLTNTGDWS